MIKGVGLKRTAAILAIIFASIWTLFSLLGAVVITMVSDILGDIFDELAIGLGADVTGFLDIVRYIFIGLAVLSIIHIIFGALFCSGRKKQIASGIILILINGLFAGMFIYIFTIVNAEVAGSGPYFYTLIGAHGLIILFTLIYFIVCGTGSKERIESSSTEEFS